MIRMRPKAVGRETGAEVHFNPRTRRSGCDLTSFLSSSKATIDFNPRTRRSGCDLREFGWSMMTLDISIRAPEDPGATQIMAWLSHFKDLRLKLSVSNSLKRLQIRHQPELIGAKPP